MPPMYAYSVEMGHCTVVQNSYRPVKCRDACVQCTNDDLGRLPRIHLCSSSLSYDSIQQELLFDLNFVHLVETEKHRTGALLACAVLPDN